MNNALKRIKLICFSKITGKITSLEIVRNYSDYKKGFII